MKFKSLVFMMVLAVICSSFYSYEKTYALTGEKYSVVVIDNEEYVTNSNGEISVFYDADGNKLNAHEAISLLNALEENVVGSNSSQYILNNNTRGVVYPYQNEVVYQSKTSKYKGNRVKVSPDVVGPATITYAESVSTSDEFGGSISISATIKALIISEVESTFGLEWSSVTSSSSSFSINTDVPSGKIGAIYFYPYLVKYNCVYYNYDGSAYSVYGIEPQKTASGFTDGLYQLVLN